jgi:hypothetical protein
MEMEMEKRDAKDPSTVMAERIIAAVNEQLRMNLDNINQRINHIQEYLYRQASHLGTRESLELLEAPETMRRFSVDIWAAEVERKKEEQREIASHIQALRDAGYKIEKEGA